MSIYVKCNSIKYYGFLIDNDTFKITGLAPNFDYDWCAFPTTSFKVGKEELNRTILNTHSRGMQNSFLELAKLAMYDEMFKVLKYKAGKFKLDTSRLGDIDKFDESHSRKLELIFNNQMRRIIRYCEN